MILGVMFVVRMCVLYSGCENVTTASRVGYIKRKNHETVINTVN